MGVTEASRGEVTVRNLAKSFTLNGQRLNVLRGMDLDVRGGEVLALVSLPVFDPQKITTADQQSPMHPFWNRALQSTLAPGSTFKIITASSALENLPNIASYHFTCTGATRHRCRAGPLTASRRFRRGR